MAFLKCSYGAGGGNNIRLVVTCAPDFAGKTITCTDGSTTLTDICPSAAPYEIIFRLPNTGTWTVSGTIDSKTYSESIIVQDFEVDLENEIDINIDVYSAANDTVSYVGLDGQTHTITTDINGHASATVRIIPSGSTFEFHSSVAKDPDNLNNDYQRNITLSNSTTSIFVMPDGKVMYWYGYVGNDTEIVNSTNGWSLDQGSISWGTPVFNTNSVTLNGGTSKLTGLGQKTAGSLNGKHHLISKGQTYTGLYATTGPNKIIQYENGVTVIIPSSNSAFVYQQNTYNGGCNVIAHGRKASSNQFTMAAWWIDNI